MQPLSYIGFQGAGKATLRVIGQQIGQGRKCIVLMIAADIYRPAAIDQLKTLGQQDQCPCLHSGMKSLQ